MNKYPAVRITPIAWQHLLNVVDAMKNAGRSRSLKDVASEAILSIQPPAPITNPQKDGD